MEETLRVKNDLRAYDKIRKVMTGQREDYATGCLVATRFSVIQRKL